MTGDRQSHPNARFGGDGGGASLCLTGKSEDEIAGVEDRVVQIRVRAVFQCE
jgi:hypothetical protein